jgi:hypothetical protein
MAYWKQLQTPIIGILLSLTLANFAGWKDILVYPLFQGDSGTDK